MIFTSSTKLLSNFQVSLALGGIGSSRSKNRNKTLEFSPLEPSIVERKVYKPGVGNVSEQQLSGGHETLRLVHVTG